MEAQNNQCDREKQFVSAVIYLHDVETTILTFLKSVDHTMALLFERYEIICVNDASKDGTANYVKNFECEDKTAALTLINMSYHQGLERSMTAGVDLAIGDFVFEFDQTHLLFSPESVKAIYQRAIEGFDIVNATPNIRQPVTSKWFYSVFNRFASFSYALDTESFRMLSRRAINRVRSMSETAPYRKALYANCGLKMSTLSFDVTEQLGSSSGNDLKRRSQLAIDALILFTDVGYRFAITMTLIMMLITTIVAIYAVIVYCFQNPVEGWTPTILFLSFSFFGIFGILAIVIKYLSIIVELIFKKRQYVYESIQKISK
ncbi:glycosyltransferase [Fusibacter paucivorans]|uniref:Glycosyltransferase n=1 Tax=Fusibacter paucivorans TaxID=76009 RepID=A0ABS5PNP9_9FIRM|nr:glycosyltransferase [Fusibacter paucivorans]MBS7526800.1 glycosyltransferase [Fusibacter paucivorans]